MVKTYVDQHTKMLETSHEGQGENMSRWLSTKESLLYMFKIVYPKLRTMDDPIKQIYDNDLSKAINDLFATLYATEYRPYNIREEECICICRNSWYQIKKYGQILEDDIL